jgi:hypothetical protein
VSPIANATNLNAFKSQGWGREEVGDVTKTGKLWDASHDSNEPGTLEVT